MARLLLLIAFVSLSASAQIFSFGGGSGGDSPLDKSIEALPKLDVESPDFEDKFRQATLEIERQLDIMRSECQEKSGDTSARKTCFRDVVTRQKKYIESAYEAKKALLAQLHKRQMTQLEQGKEQALKEFDKQF